MEVLLILNDNLLTITGAKRKSDGTFINSGTVTATLKDSSGANVAGQTWPVSLSYVAGSNGDWEATLEEELVLTEGAKYDAFVEFDAGGDLKAHWEVPAIALRRTS